MTLNIYCSTNISFQEDDTKKMTQTQRWENLPQPLALTFWILHPR